MISMAFPMEKTRAPSMRSSIQSASFPSPSESTSRRTLRPISFHSFTSTSCSVAMTVSSAAFWRSGRSRSTRTTSVPLAEWRYTAKPVESGPRL